MAVQSGFTLLLLIVPSEPEDDAPPRAITSPPPGAARDNAPVRIDSAQLFAGRDEVQIVHQGAVYRLKRTALGKLILTK